MMYHRRRCPPGGHAKLGGMGGRRRPGAPVTRKFTDYAVTVSGSLPDGIIHRELSAENLAGLALPFAAA